jgi:O-Antigen ligase
VNFNHTGPLPRLQEPFGYWNALGLFLAMGVPIALALVVDRVRAARVRLANLVALQCLFLAIGFTYSRGAIVALVVALIVYLALARARMRALMWLALAGGASVPSLVIGLTLHSLSAADISLGRRESAGLMLSAVVLLSALALVLAGRRLLGLEHRVRLSPEQSRRVTRGVFAAGAAAIVIALVAVTLSSRGLSGTVSHAWKSFTTTKATGYSDAKHLLSVDSENRWVWWKEAAGAFSDRPVTGWGAGSFPVVHLLYRRNGLTVNQPHSVPLQWLAETGIVGAALAVGAIALLLVLGSRAVRRWSLSTERLLGAAVLAAGVAYVVHSLYDWDWNIPGVTLPALVLLGVLAGSAPQVARRPQSLGRGPSAGARTFALATVVVGLCVFAVSSVLPSLAASKASAALLAADRGALADAQSSAALAAKLDPLSAAGPQAEATVALREGQFVKARSYMLEAIARDPSSTRGWFEIYFEDAALGDKQGAARAKQQIIALDPHEALVGVLAQSELQKAPPQNSATAVVTP